jgi:AraC-like DNA-binding protein
VVWAEHMVRACHGRVRIGALAQELGWSGRRFVARFRREVGVAPKTLARVLGFNHAADALRSRPVGAPFARVAAECGYADQSHFNREFRAFAVCTPTEYLAELAAD